MGVRIIFFNEYMTLIHAVGGLFLFEEDWMKHKKENAKVNEAKNQKWNVKLQIL